MIGEMKSCANREEWLGAFLYGDLPFDEESQAEEHVVACVECRSERDSLARVIGALPKPAPAPVLRRRPSPLWRTAAAALLGVVAGFLAAPRSAPPSQGDETPRASVRLVSPEAAAFVQHGAGALSSRLRAQLEKRLR
jgi:hypothetical protein